MIPKRLLLHNSIGVKKGIGKEKIEIDFTKFNNGIVGIFGATGSGKTTIIENMTPYRKLATREGSLYTHFYDQGLKEFEFSINGENYLSRIIIDTERKKMIPTLIRNGTPLTDKIDEYDNYIADIFGDYDMFINSVFNPQNSIGIIDMRDAERKNLFMNLFNILIYDNKYIPYIKDRLSNLDNRISSARLIQEEMEKDVDILTSYRVDLTEMKKTLPTLQDEVDNSHKELATHIEKINNISNDISKSETQDVLLLNLNSELNSVYQEIGQLTKDAVDQAKDVETMIESNEIDIENTKKTIGDLTKDVERGTKILQNKTKIVEKTQELAKLEQKLSKSAENRKVLIDKEGYLRVLNSEVQRDEHASQIIRNKGVPCVGHDFENTCPLLSGARTAMVDLKGKIEDRDAMDKEVKKLNKKYDFDEIVAGIEDIRKEGWDSLKDELEHYEAELEKKEKQLIVENTHLDKCIKIGTGLKTKLKSVEKKITEKIGKKKIREKELELEIEEHRKKSNVDDMKKELSNLKFMQDKYENSVNLARHSLTTTEAKIQEYEKQIVLLARKEKSVADKKSEIKQWLGHFEEWKIAEKACKEVPIFMLENLALVVTDKANSLLKNRLNNDISVRIVTTLPKAVKGYKDVFKIMVFIDGDEILANNLSGGQKAIIDASLRMAIESTLNETSAVRYDSLFWDESDHAWDANTVLMFLEMLETAKEWGNKEYIFLISHRSGIQSNVDQKIVMENL